MNWIEQNKRLASIFGVMIAGGLGLGFWFYMAWDDYSTARTEWNSMSQKSTAMENGKVYPSVANVKALDQEITEYRGEFKLLRTALLDAKAQRPVTPMSETEFQAKVKERTRAVTLKSGEFGVALPPNFALGFEEYSSALPPNAEASAELNIHLDVMEKFITTLIGARVVSIDQLQRYRLPSEENKGAAPASATVKVATTATPAPATEQVLDRYTIKCNLTTDQRALETLMNNLSNAAETHDFLVVRLMRVDNERSDAPTKEEIRAAQRNNASNETPAPPPSAVGLKTPALNVIVPPKPLPADARTIIGAETLKIYLEVDYIRFRQPPAGGAVPPKR